DPARARSGRAAPFLGGTDRPGRGAARLGTSRRPCSAPVAAPLAAPAHDGQLHATRRPPFADASTAPVAPAAPDPRVLLTGQSARPGNHVRWAVAPGYLCGVWRRPPTRERLLGDGALFLGLVGALFLLRLSLPRSAIGPGELLLFQHRPAFHRSAAA